MVSHYVTRIHATFSILTYIFQAVTKLAQLHKRLDNTSGFRRFPHKSARNSCLDSFAQYRAENSHGIVRKIRAILCRKSQRIRADIHVHPRWKFEEFFGKV